MSYLRVQSSIGFRPRDIDLGARRIAFIGQEGAGVKAEVADVAFIRMMVMASDSEVRPGNLVGSLDVQRRRFWVRLTPAQCAMYALLGHLLPMGMPRDWSVAQRIKHGHEFLVKITHQDFGYDAMRWHDYLWDSGAGGYRWSRRSREKWARQVEAAISDPVWQEAIRELDRTATEPHPSPN